MAFRTVRVAHYLAALGGMTFLAGSAAAYAVVNNFVDGILPTIPGHAVQDPDVGIDPSGQAALAGGRAHRNGAAGVSSHSSAAGVGRASRGASALSLAPVQAKAETFPNPIDAILGNLPGAPSQSPASSSNAAAADTRLFPPPLQFTSTADGSPGGLQNDVFQAGDGTGRAGETSQDPGFTPEPNALEASAVPEPASWGLMMLGFGMAGALMRRRRSTLA